LDSGGDVYCDACDVVGARLDFSGVQAGADLQSRRAQCVSDGCGAADGAGRSVESRHEAITRGVDFAAAEPVEFPV
jgi:hypothetical protein